MIGKVIYHLVAYTLVIQFKDTFAKHFSPHQFGVAMSSKCKTMVHGVRVVLDLHSKWVVLQVDNVFYLIFRTTIFQKLKFCIGTLNWFSYLFISFMHAHLH